MISHSILSSKIGIGLGSRQFDDQIDN